MGAAYIIIHNAMMQRKRREEEEEEERKKKEAEERKMIAKGYVKKYVLQNPHFRYRHAYRNISKEKTGLLLIALAASGLISITVTLIILQKFSVFFLIPKLILIIMWFIGSDKFRNETWDWSPSEKAPNKEGHYHLRTEDKAHYAYEWVKK